MSEKYKKSSLGLTASTIALATTLVAGVGSAHAQNVETANEQVEETKTLDVITVTGIRSALANAIVEKRNANNIKEVIQAEDIGKLPDQNLAEVLENVTGIQVGRTAGVGTGVQIRGTGANRVEINGVSTVSSGTGRSGISFDDLPAALIASVEVTKVPEAKTIEGSVGGTINLRTLRGLALKDRLISVRAQAERSDLAEATSPRFSGTYGDNWTTSVGDVGVVVSASYAEQDVVSFSPRFDRDREVLPGSGRLSEESFPFLRTQFLDQQLTNFEYETFNITSSIEYAPNDNLTLFLDGTLNDQQRAQQSARALISGTGGNHVVDATNNTSFETINLGTIEGPNGDLDLGSIQAVLTGTLGVGVSAGGGIDPNLRTSTNTGSRLTDSFVLSTGGKWEGERLKVSAEVSRSESDTLSPSLNTTLDFVNPRGPQPSAGASSDNGVPIEFDARNGILQFGIAQGDANAPSASELLNPANYRLRQVGQSANTNENTETALRFDGSYDTLGITPFFTSVDAGLRWNQNTALNNDSSIRTNFTNATTQFFRPTGDLFSSLLQAGPDNFDAADDRDLIIRNYLVLDPELSFSSPGAVTDALNAAILESNSVNGVDYPTLSAPTSALGAFFDIEETTTAAYFQGNYETEQLGFPIRGNLGVRWVSTEVNSVGNNVTNGEVSSQNTQNSSYDFWLPRWNLVAEPNEKLLVRAGIAKDLRRPNFDDLSTSIAFGGGANSAVTVGNPALQPESVWSFDLSGEYYLSESSLISLGVFHKVRSGVFATDTEQPASPEGADGQIERDITDPCEDGGIFNPVADRNVFSSVQGSGICVPLASTFNGGGDTTQTGIEAAFQYDLSAWEDKLGWMSGFGFIGNVTYQEEGGDDPEYRFGNGDANALNDLLGRTDNDQSTPTLADDVIQERIYLNDLSNVAYNATVFYDKYGVSMRARYTWRSDFYTNRFISFNLPRIVDDRGQLNASLSYKINDNVTLGLEGVNLLREDRTEFCVNDDALFCGQGLTDRRIVGGVSFQF